MQDKANNNYKRKIKIIWVKIYNSQEHQEGKYRTLNILTYEMKSSPIILKLK